MKAALLALVTTGALAVSAGSADARPPAYRGGYHPGYYGGYRGGYSGGYRPYYGYNSFSNSGVPYYGSGVSVGVGGFGLTVGNGYTYPYGGYYSRPYYGGSRYWGGRRGWRW